MLRLGDGTSVNMNKKSLTNYNSSNFSMSIVLKYKKNWVQQLVDQTCLKKKQKIKTDFPGTENDARQKIFWFYKKTNVYTLWDWIIKFQSSTIDNYF